MLLGKLSWAWKLPALCVLFATCCGGSVVRNVVSTTEAPLSGENTTFTCQPSEPIRMNVVLGEYKILADGRMFLYTSHRSLNASSYELKEGVATVCLPPPQCSANFRILKPLYYGMMAVFLHLQVPLLACGNRSFNSWSPLVYVAFFYAMAVAYMTSPICGVPQYPSDALWYSVPTYLSVTGLHLAGGLAVLHSDIVLSKLAELGHIYVKKGTIFFRRRSLVLKCLVLYATFVFMSTYYIVNSTTYDVKTDNFSTFRNHMTFFLPSCAGYLGLNLILAGASLGTSPSAAISGDAWRQPRSRYLPYLLLFFCGFVNWMCGLLVTVLEYWKSWDPFVIVSVGYPIVLCCFIYHNSRRVIYADWRCIKILETNGEVLIIWKHPKRQGKTGANKEKQPGKKESKELVWSVEIKSAAGKGKQPASKEHEDLALVVQKSGADKGKQDDDNELEQLVLVVEKIEAEDDKQPANKEFEQLSFMIKTRAELRSQPAGKEYVLAWLVPADRK